MKRKIIFVIPLVLLLIIPVFSLVLAREGDIVPSCNKTIGSDGKFTDECTFDSLVELGNKIINFFIVIGASLGAISIAWAGWLYLTSGGADKISQAKEIFRKVILGFILMLAAWLIVKLVLASLGYGGSRLGFINSLVGK